MTDRFDNFIRLILTRCESPEGFNHPIDSWSNSDWFVALMGEVGEAANIQKKLNRIRDGIANRKDDNALELHEKLQFELADAFHYLCFIAIKEGIDLLDVAEEKYRIVSVELGYTEPVRPFNPPVAEAPVTQSQNDSAVDS